jgi:hypothetical protein
MEGEKRVKSEEKPKFARKLNKIGFFFEGGIFFY